MLEPITNAIASVGLKAIISGGFSSAKGKAVKAYQSYFGELIRVDKNLGGELQKAARKAQLYATVLACESCLVELTRGNDKEEIKWLKNLAQSFQKQIEELSNQSFTTLVSDNDSLNLFQVESDNLQEFQQKIIKKFQEDTFNLIRTGKDLAIFNEDGFNLLKNKIENGWEKDTAPHLPNENCNWFEISCRYFQHEYNSNPKLTAEIQKHQNLQVVSQLNSIVEELSKIDVIQELVRATNENVRALIENQKINTKHTQDVPLLNLPNLNVKVYDRENEAREILQFLRGEPDNFTEQSFALIIAPSAFGKTFLLTKVLQAVVEGRTIKPEYQIYYQRIIVIDCRLKKTLRAIVESFDEFLTKSLEYNPKEKPPREWLASNLFLPLPKTLIIFDNFETWLDVNENYAVNSYDLKIFLGALFGVNHNWRGMFFSQMKPSDFADKMEELYSIGTELYKGLPEEDGLRMLREKGAVVGLDKADESLLKEFLEKIVYIPQAIDSLIGYLKKKKAIFAANNYSFTDFMAENSRYWAEFDAEEKVESDLEKGIRRTKNLIARQVEIQSEDLKLLLRAIAFFDKPVSINALELLFDDTGKAENTISLLTENLLATTQRGLRGTTRYDLHAYFREQSREVLPAFESLSINFLTNYTFKLDEKGLKFAKEFYFNQAISLFECGEKIYDFLISQKGLSNLKFNLAGLLVNHSASLRRLNKPDQAILKLDEAANYYKQSRHIISDELMISLARVYVHKGHNLRILNKLDDAMSSYNESIKLHKRLSLEYKKKDDIKDDYAACFISKGNILLKLASQGLISSEEVEEGLNEINKAIEILAKIFDKKLKYKIDFATAHNIKGSLLMYQKNNNEDIAVLNKGKELFEELINEENQIQLRQFLGILLSSLGLALLNKRRFNESVDTYISAIEIIEDLIEQGRTELENDIARAYMSKGLALEKLIKLDDSLASFDIGIVWRKSGLERGENHNLPDYIMDLQNRIRVLIKLKDWKRTAKDIIEAFKFLPYLEEPTLPKYSKEMISNQLEIIISYLREISTDNREEIYTLAGKAGEIIQSYVMRQ